jgi:NitT/TauT family transport system substrate-binding protein
MKTDISGGGDVSIVPQENAQTLEQFRSGAVQGAWLPEPWASRLVQEAGAKVLVNERDLWPGGQFVTTHLIVRTKFADEHPEAVQKLLEAHLAATAFVNEKPAEAQKLVNAGIEKVTGKALPEALITAAWANLTFTYDPVATSLYEGAEAAKSVGLLETDVEIDGIYDIEPLNELLGDSGQPAVKIPAPQSSSEKASR